MNSKEELKSAVIKACVDGNLTVKDAAKKLKFSERYIKKLKASYRNYGVSSMLHGNCGKQPSITINSLIKSKIIEIRLLPEYEECNNMHFKDFLSEYFNINISYSSLTSLFKKNRNC